MSQQYALSYSAILEQASGDLTLGDATVFKDGERRIGVFPSPEEAVAAWVCKRGHQDVDLVELRRWRGLGLVYSACPQDGSDSFLYDVQVDGHSSPTE